MQRGRGNCTHARAPIVLVCGTRSIPGLYETVSGLGGAGQARATPAFRSVTVNLSRR
jgi:hypothetical protein